MFPRGGAEAPGVCAQPAKEQAARAGAGVIFSGTALYRLCSRGESGREEDADAFLTKYSKRVRRRAPRGAAGTGEGTRRPRGLDAHSSAFNLRALGGWKKLFKSSSQV